MYDNSQLRVFYTALHHSMIAPICGRTSRVAVAAPV